MLSGLYVMCPDNESRETPALAERYINPCAWYGKALQVSRYAVGEQLVKRHR